MNISKEVISCGILSTPDSDGFGYDIDLVIDNIDTLINYGVKTFNVCMLDQFCCYSTERLIEITNEIPNVTVNLVLCEEDITHSYKPEENKKVPISATYFYQFRYLTRLIPEYFDDEVIAIFNPSSDGIFDFSKPDHVNVTIFDNREDVEDFCKINSNLILSENGRLIELTFPFFDKKTLIFQEIMQ